MNDRHASQEEWTAVSTEVPERPRFLDADAPIDVRIDDLISRMSDEEKIAQLVGVSKTNPDYFRNEDFTYSVEKALLKLKNGLGHIGMGGAGAKPRESVLFMNELQQRMKESTRLGIPVISHEEALHGHVAEGGTAFPQAIGLASSWDEELFRRVFTAVAKETRARGHHQVFAPVLDVCLDPRWGRVEETYGEDPYLVARLGVACIKALQGTGTRIDGEHVIATIKHYAGYGTPDGGTNAAPSQMGVRMLREIILPSFEAAIKEAEAESVMASYNEIDGVPSHVNSRLLREILRDEWGFEGVVVSDYNGIDQLVTSHRLAESNRQAAELALNAGVDMELPDPLCFAAFTESLAEGTINAGMIDLSVKRVLRHKFILGLFENPLADPEEAEEVSECHAHRQLAKEAACASIVLLKNESSILPLDRSRLKSIALVGPHAAECELGGYSGLPENKVTLLDGIKAKLGPSVEVKYAKGCDIVRLRQDDPDQNDRTFWTLIEHGPGDEEETIEEAVETASSCDIAVVAVGENHLTCRESWPGHPGDRTSLGLIGNQNELVKRIAHGGTPTVVVLVNGRPLAIDWIADNVPAIVECWYGGQEMGAALADVLFGDFNPCGKLPITFPRSVGHLPCYYHQKNSRRDSVLFTTTKPLFPFGHGLSYSDFSYDNLRITPESGSVHTTVRVSIDIANTGSRPGEEIVQLYIRDDAASVTRPVKLLRGFRKVSLQPGEKKSVHFTVTPDDLALWDRSMRRVVEPGSFTIMVGPSSESLQSGAVRLE